MLHKIHVLLPRDPGPLKESEIWTADPPLKALYARGNLSLLERLPEHGFAVVGTRYPLERSVDETHRIISRLKGSELIIVSGFARGIDEAAHRAALEAELPTIAVVAAGIDVPYPAHHAELGEKIVQAGGLIISEHPPGTLPKKSYFLDRNRLIAGWSKATWVVEAASRSGALNTARHARDACRLTYATPDFPGEAKMAGIDRLFINSQALPLIEVESLGHTWPRFASWEKSQTAKAKQLELQFASEDERDLFNRVRRNGATHPQALLAWAIGRKWAPSRFFGVLRNATQTGLLIDQNGLLLKNPSL